jgi:NDP-sugar pyrophosphorylase family protein
LAAVWLEPDRGPRTVETVGGRVTTFASRRAGAAGTATFCGLHLLAPRILDYLPEKEAFIPSLTPTAARAGAAKSLPGCAWRGPTG